MNDEILMSQVAEGDLDKMSILFKKYHGNLFNFYLKKGHDISNSEDLAQMVFERLLKYRSSYKTSLPFRAWFFRIARNVEYDFFQKTKVKLDDSRPISSLHLTSENVMDKIEQKEDRATLNQAIALLSPEEQELLHFSKFQKMRYEDISKIMNLSESAVKVKIHRAIKKLRVHYQKLGLL